MRMPRHLNIKHLLCLIGVCSGVCVLARLIFIDNSPDDMLMAALTSIDGNWTVYSKDYDESKFRALRKGMTEQEVQDSLGIPLHKSEWYTSSNVIPGTIWEYTRAGKQRRGSYWRKDVYFRNHVVVDVSSSFRVD